MKQLIINCEYFFQCQGHCVGCFLTEIEKKLTFTYDEVVLNNIKKIQKNFQQEHIEHLVIGFGRGNILNIPKINLNKLLNIIKWCKENFKYKKITFEVSTSLIGKIENQITNALYLLNKDRDIFFNIVVNSEITSKQFWNNLQLFYQATSDFRKNNLNYIVDWGDIVVLNINPKNLPNLNFINNFFIKYHSPINISIFPFNKEQNFSSIEIKKLNEWGKEMWEILKDKDLNIKNYLNELNKINVGENIQDFIEYQKNTEKTYYFIDKNGMITNGSLSIMGEVDKLRLLDKYNLSLNLEDAYKKFQKNKTCLYCEYQKECLLSGAYLNFLANSNKISSDSDMGCLSGYYYLFSLSKKEQ